MIDLHTHLLPGVDDGSPNVHVSGQVLERFAREGVERVICTPHLLASRADRAPIARHRELLAELREHLITLGAPVPALELGWEIMLDRPGCDLAAPHLAMAGTRVVLVELPRRFIPPGATVELARLRAAGLVPVVAHPERYPGITLAMLREWREAGCVIQTDADMLVGRGSRSEMAKAMLAEGLVDVLASDNHGDLRSLGTVRRWLEELGAREQAELLTRLNPERLLRGEAPLPVPPARLERGVLHRLRELVLGRR